MSYTMCTSNLHARHPMYSFYIPLYPRSPKHMNSISCTSLHHIDIPGALHLSHVHLSFIPKATSYIPYTCITLCVHPIYMLCIPCTASTSPYISEIPNTWIPCHVHLFITSTSWVHSIYLMYTSPLSHRQRHTSHIHVLQYMYIQSTCSAPHVQLLHPPTSPKSQTHEFHVMNISLSHRHPRYTPFISCTPLRHPIGNVIHPMYISYTMCTSNLHAQHPMSSFYIPLHPRNPKHMNSMSCTSLHHIEILGTLHLSHVHLSFIP
jgi:hypothetical protein